ncbi:MAG: hypothetical protein HOO96_02260 [Polyangiaceae bacterium]|nr:hypothetical protein [Polyangiaceae bacterium]
MLPTFAVLGALSVLFLPFGFRDLPTADHMGHEAQHLGWLNSMTHGCLPFADCGFIYGPLREVSIFALSRGFGGLTLEHVRMSHIALTSVGVLLLIACLRTISGNLVTFLSATWLLLFHTALVSFVVYDGTYSLGWSDTLRAALPCAALVFGLRAGTSPLRIWAAGIAAGLSCLYSHDFGFLAIGAGAVGALVQGWLVPGTQGARARSATLHALRFVGGASAVLLTFALAYAAAGRGPRLLAALRWVLLVASGKAAFAREPFPIFPDTFVRLVSLYERIEPANSLGTTRADYLFAPLIPLAAAPILARRFASALRSLEGTASLPRFIALALFAALVFRHPFMSADGWHLANATAPSLLVLAMLLSETDSRQRWASTWRGSVAAAITLLWTAAGAHVPLAHRVERLTSGQEHPSRGPRFVYRDLERAGDVSIPVATLGDVRALREATGPDGTLFATTWMLGGGLEAFLVGRPNPTGIDVPHEVASPAQQADLLRRMQAHPPTIIYGSSFEYFGPQVQRYIEANWVTIEGARLAPMRRYHGE